MGSGVGAGVLDTVGSCPCSWRPVELRHHCLRGPLGPSRGRRLWLWKQLRLWAQMGLSWNPPMLPPKARPLLSLSLHLQTGWSPGGPSCQRPKSLPL